MKYPIFQSKQITADHRLILLSGDEPFFIDATLKLIKQRYKNAGIESLNRYTISTNDDMNQLVADSQTPSLFSEQSLFICRFNGYPKAPIQKQLEKLVEQLDEDNVFVFITEKLSKKQQQSVWVKAVEEKGKHFESLKLKAHEFRRWLEARLKQKQISSNNRLLDLLTEHYEDNLLAAHQAIENLALVSHEGKVSGEDLTLVLSQQSQYTIFQCTDEALCGNTKRALSVLSELKANRAEPILILWSLAKELRLIASLLADKENGASLPTILKKANIWQSKTHLYQQALNRHTIKSSYRLLQRAKIIDGAIKGLNKRKPWDELHEIISQLSLTSEFVQSMN